MSTIKLLVCYHKPSYLLKDEIMTPIHVGRKLTKEKLYLDNSDYEWLMNNLIGDDTGENISEKNGSYNEITSLYWAWKNYDKLDNPDYIGLMHYRRHFVLRPGEIGVIRFDKIDENTYFDEINYSPEKMYALVEECDFIAHIGKVNNIYKHYLENHRQEDLDIAFNILYELYPEYNEIAKEYLAGDLSNFCNMFIFSKKIFFEYCEWLFTILNEFENRVDISSKRLFISERLTGVYIAKLMKDTKFKYKVVPISYVSESIIIPLVIPYEKKTEFQIATTILSLLKSKKEDSIYSISLVCDDNVDEKTKSKFEALVTDYAGSKIQFIETQIQPEYYPLMIAELFPEINKCIYLTEDIIILKDLQEFYCTCSTDDYYVVGTPLEDYNIYDSDKQIQLRFLVMNLTKLRQKSIFRNATTEIKKGKDATILFNEVCQGIKGYVPWYYITIVGNLSDGIHLFNKEKTRMQLQEDAAWKPIMFYNEDMPWRNPQDIFSLFWWKVASVVPVSFKFPMFNEDMLKVIFELQQREINEVGTQIKNPNPLKENSEDWRNYSLLGKLKFYYQNNGFKNTVKYCCKKYILREK